MIGRFTTGSSGLGWLAVIGRSLVPSPPAITTAFTAAGLLSRRASRHVPGRAHPAVTPVAAVPPPGPGPASNRLACTRYSTAAHQYRALPQIAKVQPATLAV